MWKQYPIKKGTLILLDIYGTNHDSRLWLNPYEFNPERFKNWTKNNFSFMPQGGECNEGHRCAGELVTIEVMKASFDYIANHLSYKVPKQNLHYRLSRIPTLLQRRFIMSAICSLIISE